MPRARRRKDEQKPIEANLIPVLSCMFLLIPALLLAMEVARMVQIPVSPPKWSSNPTGQTNDTHDLKLAVHIREDGFAATTGTGDDLEIPLREGEYDYGALNGWAYRLKAHYPKEWTVTISAENAVELQVLIEAMDSLRGTDCKLAGAFAGEEVPRECLLWRPIVSASPIG